MSDAARPARPGWVRDVELPRSLDELHGPTSGTVRLPLRLCWSGPDPEAVEWDTGTSGGRRWLYEVVLREGTLDDVRVLVNGHQLVRLRDDPNPLLGPRTKTGSSPLRRGPVGSVQREVFADGGRLHVPVELAVGPVLHPDDLAADKVLAMWGER